MATFAKYYPLLIKNEGGYVFDPHDPGGETWRGVARNYQKTWEGWDIIDKYKKDYKWTSELST